MTLELLRDVGCFPDADLDGVADNLDCEPNSELALTVVVDGCDSGVPNALFASGCTISDLIAHIGATARNHGKFVSGVAHLGEALVANGTKPPHKRMRFRVAQPTLTSLSGSPLTRLIPFNRQAQDFGPAPVCLRDR